MLDKDKGAGFERTEIVVFALGGEQFGIEITQVREVAVLPEITPVPSMPPWLLGVVNLRGEVIPVVSLARAVGIAESGAGGDRMIVAWIGERPIGLAVAGVPRIERVDPGLVEPAPDLVAHRLKRDFIRGVVKEVGGLTILLDLTAIIRLEEIEATNEGG